MKYGAANLKAMDLFKGPKNAKEWLQFMGNASEKAPYQIFYPDKTPDGISALNTDIPGCGSTGFECSCADCGTASYCKQVVPHFKNCLTQTWFLELVEHAIFFTLLCRTCLFCCLELIDGFIPD